MAQAVEVQVLSWALEKGSSFFNSSIVYEITLVSPFSYSPCLFFCHGDLDHILIKTRSSAFIYSLWYFSRWGDFLFYPDCIYYGF